MSDAAARRGPNPAGILVVALFAAFALAGLLLGAAPAARAGAAAAQAGEQARIVDFDFAPGRLTVDVGTTVTWRNTGQRPHTASDRGGTFDTRPISPGATGKVTFSTPGTYFYFCRINPAKMNGVVVVRPGDQPAKVTRVQAVDPGFTGDRLRFDPARLTVPAGSTLLVANVGGRPHTLTADDGSFDTGAIAPGAEGGRFAGKNKSVTLTEPGTFRFHCEVHPAAMKGVVRVTGGAAAGGSPAAAAAPVAAGGGDAGPGGGVSAWGIVTAVLGAFLGGFGLSAFALRRRRAG